LSPSMLYIRHNLDAEDWALFSRCRVQLLAQSYPPSAPAVEPGRSKRRDRRFHRITAARGTWVAVCGSTPRLGKQPALRQARVDPYKLLIIIGILLSPDGCWRGTKIGPSCKSLHIPRAAINRNRPCLQTIVPTVVESRPPGPAPALWHTNCRARVPSREGWVGESTRRKAVWTRFALASAAFFSPLRQ
jgi:hypothetical protein